MKRSILVLIIGIVLIVIAVGILGVFYTHGTKYTEVLSVSPNSSKYYYFNLTGNNNYVIYITSQSNISCKIYSPSGKLLDEKNNISQITFNITHANGKYKLVVHNNENSQAEVVVFVAEESAMNSLMYGVYASGGFCCLGMVVVIIAFIMLLWDRKMEEKQYKRY